MQKMNTKIFKNPKQLMDNVIRVTDHLRHKIVQRGGNPARETLEMIPCRDGAWYYQDVDGECWRCYYMIDGTMSYEKVENPRYFITPAEPLVNLWRICPIFRRRPCLK